MAKRGRPKSDNPLASIVPVRLTADQLRAVTKAAKRDNKTKAEWVRDATLAALAKGPT